MRSCGVKAANLVAVGLNEEIGAASGRGQRRRHSFLLVGSIHQFGVQPISSRPTGRQLIIENGGANYAGNGDEGRQADHPNISIGHIRTAWIGLFLVGYLSMWGGIYCFWRAKTKGGRAVNLCAGMTLVALAAVLIVLGTNNLTSLDRRPENVLTKPALSTPPARVESITPA